MSQYGFQTNKGRRLIFGCDKPTGGFFLTELYTEQEMEENHLVDEVVVTYDGKTLTEIMNVVSDHYAHMQIAFSEYTDRLIADWIMAPAPTLLQINVGLMFGKDIAVSLFRVNHDLEEHFGIGQ